MGIFLPEHFKIVDASAGCVTTDGGVTCDYVSLRNVNAAWIVIQLTQAVGHATVVQPQKATAITPAGATSITVAAELWENEDTASTDTFVKQTAATSLTLTDDAKKKQVIVKINPDALGSTYDVLGCTISDSSQATNFVAVQYFLEMRYPQATPPAAIS